MQTDILTILFKIENFPKKTANHKKKGKKIALYRIKNSWESKINWARIIYQEALVSIQIRRVNHITVRLLKNGSEVM